MSPEATVGPPAMVSALSEATATPEQTEQLASLAQAGRTVAWLARQLEVGLARVDLSMPQYRLLGLLAEGSAVSSEIAQRLAVRPPSVTAVVDGLVGRGLVERRHLEGDRRCVALALTPEGRGLLEVGNREVDRQLRILGEGLSPDDLEAALAGLIAWRRALLARMAERKETMGLNRAGRGGAGGR